jgi:hypothetical protein
LRRPTKLAAVTAVTAVIGTALLAPAGPAAAAPPPAATAGIQAYSCDVTTTGDKLYAGYYSGESVTPSSTAVTAAGKEAQCLLRKRGFDPGTLDGIFGSNSQTAAKKFQLYVNGRCGRAVLDVDGKVGPRTWPYLRQVAFCFE